MYIGHKRDDRKVQKLADHLNNVSRMAAEFAECFDAFEHARRVGVAHDIGKYAQRAQARQRDPEHVPKADHSTAGARLMYENKDLIAAFAIAGHHGGLMNIGGKFSTPSDGTLYGRIKKEIEDYSAYRGEVTIKSGALFPKWIDFRDGYAAQFYTRMLFSCLVDADFLDTEKFMLDDPPRRGGGASPAELLSRLKAYIAAKFGDPKRDIDVWRTDILYACLRGAEYAKGIYTLTVPTGGGKTISSLAFALAHAAARGLRRVIYVVPYVSIIEQNAMVFAEILGAENVLEHHANASIKDDGYDSADSGETRRRLAAENWDAPVVVTTAVQFFESLYACRTSRCRKLHNIADSVIVFDEAQMLPLSYLRPCVAAIAELARHYGVTAVLCTATQPALSGLISEFAPEMNTGEICPDVDMMASRFRRVNFIWEGEKSDDAVALSLRESKQVLCVLNSRRRARRLFELLPEEGRFHISTLMTASHRTRTLSAIRAQLKDGKICRVVSTSCIEAGVDVDFNSVWREEAGLDSILQAAGRCNREGKMSAAESTVHVFRAEGGAPPMFRQNIAATRAAVGGGAEYDSPNAIRDYFEHLLALRGESIDYRKIMQICEAFDFAKAADEFKLIDTDTVTIFIPTDENESMLSELRRGNYSLNTIRKLGRDSVSVFRSHYIALYGAGKLEATKDGFLILADNSLYDSNTGLSLDMDVGAALWG